MLSDPRPMLVTVCLGICLAGSPTHAEEETFGCEANPTGNPIGGGKGYTKMLARGDFTVKTKEDLVAALKKAASGQIVWLPDGVEIDLTGGEAIDVPAEVTLASTRGLDGSLGARLFSTKPIKPMLRTAGDRVRLTGLRIEGPEPGVKSADTSAGVEIRHYGAQVDNCEVYNFGYAGIGIGADAGKVQIRHNYIHHCQRSGLGYGVATQSSSAHIVANRFNYTRHAIASSGRPGSGYEAAWNQVGPHATSHHFDMHSSFERGDGTFIAGDWMIVHHNTFLGPQRAVCIRGVPSQEARIHHNWFARPPSREKRGTIVYSWGHTLVYRNVHGPDKRLQQAPYYLTAHTSFADPDTHYTMDVAE